MSTLSTRIVLASLCLVSLLPAAKAVAQTVDPLNGYELPLEVPVSDATLETVTHMLLAIHELPSAQDFLAVGPDVRAALWEIARDAEAFSLYRHHALEALGYWPDASYVALLDELMVPGSDSGLSPHRLMVTAQHTLGPAATDLIARYLDSPDAQVRRTAVHTLAAIGTHESHALIAEAGEDEPAPVVLREIDSALLEVR